VPRSDGYAKRAPYASQSHSPDLLCKYRSNVRADLAVLLGALAPPSPHRSLRSADGFTEVSAQRPPGRTSLKTFPVVPAGPNISVVSTYISPLVS
jgi:hypothetical protein